MTDQGMYGFSLYYSLLKEARLFSCHNYKQIENYSV